jgi:23S rRNA pseudouridine2605 synthase
MQKVRLQKYISVSGVASRRKAEDIIKQGRVRVNGKPIKEMGFKVSQYDRVSIDGKPIIPESKKIYIMLNKPCGYVSSTKDQFSRKTVLELVGDTGFRIYPVGRLDYNTSGLIILTNDGKFSYEMTHPSKETEKTYIARISGNIDKKDIEKFKKGIMIDGFLTSPAKLNILKIKKSHTFVEITIHEGRNRQVRKMFSSIGHPVQELKRIKIGNLRLGNLCEGCWRYLTQKEADALVKSNHGRENYVLNR